MTLKQLYIIGGIIVLFMSLVPLKHKISSYKTQIYGETINVKVTSVPEYYSDVNYYFKFQFEDNGNVKEIPKLYFPKYCGNLIVGQELKLKTNKDKTIFLYQNEDVRTEFYALSILGLFGVTLFIVGLKKRHT